MINSIKLKQAKDVGVVFLLFGIIYFPPLCPINTVFIIGLAAWTYLLINNQTLGNFIYVRKVILVWAVLLLLVVYILTVGILQQNKLVRNAGSLTYLTLFIFPAVVALAVHFKKSKYDFMYVVKLVIYAGLVQTVLVLLAAMSKPVQQIFCNSLLYIMRPEDVEYWSTIRLFGWSNTLTYSMPIAQGAIGFLALIYALKKDIRFMIAVPAIWLSGVLNARTTFVIILLAMFCVMFTVKLLCTKTFKTILFLTSCGILALVCVYYMSSKNFRGRWIMEGINEIFSFLKGEKTGYFLYLDKIHNPTIFMVPTGTDFILGAGKTISSDVGYFENLWIGGLLYLCGICMLFICLIYLMKAGLVMQRIERKTARGISFFILLVFAISNIKGSIFGLNEFTNLFFILYAASGFVKLDKY